MKARFVNPFVNAAVYTFHQSLPDIEIERGSPLLVAALPSQTGITAKLQFFGELDGYVIYFMETPTCLDIVSDLNETQISEINDLARSTVGELANIITGQSAIRLEAKNCQVDISTPCLHVGSPEDCWEIEENKILHLPLHTGYGDINIHLAFT
ncbi:MAG: chemotaxis protein CheX [bacterium]